MTFYQYQKDFLKSTAKFRVVNKSRQIGFSWLIAYECAIGLLEGKRSLILSTGMRASHQVLEKAKQWLYILTNDIKFKKETQSELALPNGGEIISLPPSPETARGFTGDSIYLDEAAFIRGAKEIMKAIGPSLTRDTGNKRLTIISTPFGKQGFFYDVYTDKKKYAHFERFSVDLQMAINHGMPASIPDCLAFVGASSESDPGFRQEYCCEFIDEEGSFFPYELIHPSIDTDLKDYNVADFRSGLYYAGYDPARQVDSGVFCVVEKTSAGQYIVRHIKAWLKVPYSEQIAHIKTYSMAGIAKLKTDQTGVGQKIQEDLQGAMGSKAEGVTFTNAIKEKMIVNLRQLFQDGKIKIPNDPRLIHELHSLQRKQSDTVIRYQHADGEHDDYVWALALACYGGTVSEYMAPALFTSKGIR